MQQLRLPGALEGPDKIDADAPKVPNRIATDKTRTGAAQIPATQLTANLRALAHLIRL
ncbi:hypothetical protein [Halochromatium roseum]|uniref:hypothetical protein n=1 Tax=Halochromatium roseum TaxID=391920 RepID=UPI0019114CC0|nr:hypothetical protein [Halochromatium roseum]